MKHLRSRSFPPTTVEVPDNRAGEVISEVKHGCQPAPNDCLPLLKLNTTKTQTCNCGGAESDAVAIVWTDICNYGTGEKKPYYLENTVRAEREKEWKHDLESVCEIFF